MQVVTKPSTKFDCCLSSLWKVATRFWLALQHGFGRTVILGPTSGQRDSVMIYFAMPYFYWWGYIRAIFPFRCAPNVTILFFFTGRCRAVRRLRGDSATPSGSRRRAPGALEKICISAIQHVSVFEHTFFTHHTRISYAYTIFIFSMVCLIIFNHQLIVWFGAGNVILRINTPLITTTNKLF